MGRIAVVAAMREELHGFLDDMGRTASKETRAGREFFLGEIAGHEVVAVLSGIGKVAAAITATTLLDRYGVGAVLFTGVAGGVGDGVRVGDIVIADALVQHDMDARPLFPRFEVPLTGTSRFAADAQLAALARTAAEQALALDLAAEVDAATLAEFGVSAPRVHAGLIASGDQFIADAGKAAQLCADLPGLLAVEMEGAAVAQVCADHGMPLAVMRTVSDRADAHAAFDFGRFVERVASRYSHVFVRRLLDALSA
ncbi:5'-methylthioadenosine/adenosylhomocysteine nucleosidase [Derxia lacustris]|uniref:5'-methylthioadenosine/adenosylhomocysteine nucleosidase n=1 Tax=Derxia lacustris TaxID=764842 RepID=UPI000A16DE4B|nr:5'-methylthioadenosine/adenosylhomocysteine nucleosidase [Derxia lacustris]